MLTKLNKIISHMQNRTRHAANENTHKLQVHTRHDNVKARRQWKTQAACHTAQDITWMHAADKTRTACNHKTHVDRRACGRAKSRLHIHTTRQNTERKCPNPDTKPKLKTWVLGSEHYAPIRKKARRRESARLEHTRSHTLMWKQDITRVSGLCHKTHE